MILIDGVAIKGNQRSRENPFSEKYLIPKMWWPPNGSGVLDEFHPNFNHIVTTGFTTQKFDSDISLSQMEYI